MSLSVDIRHRFDAFALDAQFDAPPGVTVLFGRSGSGKTSLVNAVAGLFTPKQGLIRLNDRVLFNGSVNIPVHQRRFGYIFQEARLFPHLTVRQNLLYGARFAPKGGTKGDMDRIVQLLGIESLLGRRPSRLSGGEAQRVAIGRALLSSPQMLLADEPLAALDAQRKAEILPYLERLRDELGIPILYVSHSAAEVARLATTVVVLDQGKVIRQGKADQVLGDPSIAPTGVRAVGAVLNTTVTAHHDDGLTEIDAGGTALFLPKTDLMPGTELRVRIPAQDVMLSLDKPHRISALNILQGDIVHIRDGDGPGCIVSLDTKAGVVLARITRRSAELMGLHVGQSIWAVVKTVSIARTDISGS